MKLSRWEGGILFLSVVFLAFTAGWFLRGAASAEPLRVETERRLETTSVALPAPDQPPELEKVNVNTAGKEELMTLPGIGEKRAAAIVADRERNGPFRFPEEISRVEEIGRAHV